MGIHLRSNKSQLLEESGETTSRFDVQMDFSEIHVPCWFSFRVYVDIGNMSVYEITSLIMLFRFVFSVFFSAHARRWHFCLGDNETCSCFFFWCPITGKRASSLDILLHVSCHFYSLKLRFKSKPRLLLKSIILPLSVTSCKHEWILKSVGYTLKSHSLFCNFPYTNMST